MGEGKKGGGRRQQREQKEGAREGAVAEAADAAAAATGERTNPCLEKATRESASVNSALYFSVQ